MALLVRPGKGPGLMWGRGRDWSSELQRGLGDVDGDDEGLGSVSKINAKDFVW